MGEWDLQPPQWNHPDFHSQLLQGPLGPELLHNKHGKDVTWEQGRRPEPEFASGPVHVALCEWF